MSPQPTVTVRGSALARTEPDEAELLITLTALMPDPGASLSDVSRRAQALTELLDRIGVARGERSSTGITIYEEFDHRSSGRHSLGHRAVLTVAVRLIDLELIGPLVTRASTELAAQISGPHWEIAPDNPARVDVARAAAADGRRKAEAYAAGVGARLGALVKLAEPEPTSVMRGFARRAAAVAAAAGPDMPVEAGEQQVTAAIDVTFELETG